MQPFEFVHHGRNQHKVEISKLNPTKSKAVDFTYDPITSLTKSWSDIQAVKNSFMLQSCYL